MYDLEVDCVRRKVAELISLHPDKQARIEKAISDIKKFDFMKPHELKKMLEADQLLAKHTQKSTNITFKQQQEMKVKLVEAAYGDQSDYESDYEDMSSLEDPTAPSRQEAKLEQG